MKSSDRVNSSDSISSTASGSSSETIVNNFSVFDPLVPDYSTEKPLDTASVTWPQDEAGLCFFLSSVKTNTFLNLRNVKHMLNEAGNKFTSPLIVLVLDELQAITEEIFNSDPEESLSEAIHSGALWIAELENTVSELNEQRKIDSKSPVSYDIVRWQAFTKLPKFKETHNFVTAVLYPDKASGLFDDIFPSNLDNQAREKLIADFVNTVKQSDIRKFISNTVTIFIKKNRNRLIKTFIEREHNNLYFLANDGTPIRLRLDDNDNIIIEHPDTQEVWDRDKFPIQPKDRANCKIRLNPNGFPVLAQKNGLPILIDSDSLPVTERLRIQSLMIKYLINEFVAFILLGNIKDTTAISEELLDISGSRFLNIDKIKPILPYPISASYSAEGSNAINTFTAFFKTRKVYNEFARQLALPENSKLTVVDSLVPHDVKTKKRIHTNNITSSHRSISPATVTPDLSINAASTSQQSLFPRRSSSLPPTLTQYIRKVANASSKTDEAIPSTSITHVRTNSLGSASSSSVVAKKSPPNSPGKKRTHGLTHKSTLFPPNAATGQSNNLLPMNSDHEPINEIVAKLISVLTSPIRTKHINYNNGVRGTITILGRKAITGKKLVTASQHAIQDAKSEQETLSDYFRNIMLSAVDSNSGEINVTVGFEWRNEEIEIQAIFPLDVLIPKHQQQDNRQIPRATRKL